MRRVIAAGLLWVAVAVAGADDIRPVAELTAMPRAGIADRPPVRIAGQVISVGKLEAILEDAAGGIRVVGIDRATREPANGDTAELAVGDVVEVEGRVEADGPSTVLRAERIVVSDRAPLPRPRRCELEAFFSGVEDCRFIEVEGIVEQAWREDHRLLLEIAAVGRLFAATIPAAVLTTMPEIDADPRTLVDAVVRVAGPAASECNQRGEIVRPIVRVERGEWLTLVEPAATPVFRSMAVPMDAIGIRHAGTGASHRVRTFGQVIHAVPGETLFLQNGHTGIRVGLATGAIGSDERFVPGDNVEVAGFLDRSGHVVGIRNAAATRIGGGVAPEPLVATPAAILAAAGGDREREMVAAPGDYDGCLVTFSARLLQSQPTTDGGVLLLRCVDSIVTAEADGATFAAIAGTEPSSLVRVAGVAGVERERPGPFRTTSPRRLRLILRGVDDFRVIRSPPWWTPERLLAVLGLTGAVLAAALVWGATLRRQLGHRTRELAAEMRCRRDAALEFEATLRERNRLAANLHDTLQQTIGGIGFQLDACEAAAGGEGAEARRHLAVARQMVSHAAKELQGSVWAMRSLPLEGKAFPEALSALVSRVAEGHDVELSVRTEGALGDLPEFVSGSVLLLVQEAVYNALKHGKPGRIGVTVVDDPGAGTLRAEVADDGCGFEVGTQAGPRDGHFGIEGMRERAARLGGSLAVRSRPGGGTRVEVVVERRDYDADLGTPRPDGR